MYITLETDYAIRIVDCLVHSDHRMDAQSISEATYVSLRFSLKILRKLVTAGIVQSFKGAKGGYILAREPIDITLRDVIEAVEGPYRFSRCLAEDYECVRNQSLESTCVYHQFFDHLSQVVINELSQFNFQTIKDSPFSCLNADTCSEKYQEAKD